MKKDVVYKQTNYTIDYTRIIVLVCTTIQYYATPTVIYKYRGQTQRQKSIHQSPPPLQSRIKYLTRCNPFVCAGGINVKYINAGEMTSTVTFGGTESKASPLCEVFNALFSEYCHFQ